MKNLGQTIIQTLFKLLILLLPYEYQDTIIGKQDELESQGHLLAEIQAKIFRMILGAYISLIIISLNNTINRLKSLDPSYCINIYSFLGHRVTKQIEKEFLSDYYKIKVRSMQISGISLILLYIFLGILDIWYLSETKITAWLVKLFILPILFLATYLSFRSNIFSKYNQQIMKVSFSAAILGIISIISLSRINELGHHAYYGALMVVMFYIYLISGLRFYNALVVSLILLCGYAAVDFINQSNHFMVTGYQSQASRRYFINYFFLVSSLIAGASACNVIERIIRINFLIRYTISNCFRDFLIFFEYEDPQKFLINISKLSSSPQVLQRFLLQSFRPFQVSGLEPTLDNTINKKFFLEQDIRQPKKRYSKTFSSNFLFRISNCINFLIKLLASLSLSFARKSYGGKDQEKLEKIETLFKRDYFQSSLVSLRLTIIYSFVFYGLFAIADVVCLPESKTISIPIRISFCLMATIVFFFSLLSNLFQRFHQAIIGISALLASLGIILMIVLSKPTEIGYVTYYSGLILVMFYVFLFGRLLFLNALLVGFSIVLIYVMISIYFQGVLSSFENTELFVSNVFFLTVSCTVGSIACYFFERDSRLDFLTRYTIAYKAQELLAYYEHTYPTPKQLLDLINGIRHSPKRLQEFLMELLAFQRENSE